MVNLNCSRFGSKIRILSVGLLLAFSAGCATVTVKDDIPPGTPKGYADFANYTVDYDVIYSMKGGRKVREGSLGFKGESLRLARTPGNYDFLIEHRDDSGKKHSRLVNLTIERDMVSFVTVDNRIKEVIDNINERMPLTTVIYRLDISVAKTPAPLRFDSDAARDRLPSLFKDPDWRARLYAVSSLGKSDRLRDAELAGMVTALAADDPRGEVRRKAAAVLKDLGRDPYENLLFLDNFEANDKRRWISAAGRYTYFYNDEFLLSSAPDKCETEMMTAPLELSPAFDVELVVNWKSGADTGDYGILMGSDKDNFDHFGIAGDGRAMVRPTRNGELEASLIDWTSVDGINKRGSNRLKVEVRGDKWSYSVNGAYVGTVESTPDLSAYTFGLRVCRGQTVAFDQLKISWKPEADLQK